MKILLCTKNDIFGALILSSILPRLVRHDVRVLLSAVVRPTEHALSELIEEKFLERDLPIEMLFPLLDKLGEDAELLTMQGAARKFNVPMDVVTRINDPHTEQALKDWAPDLIFSARFSLIFKQNILSIPRHGAYNIHPGTLPGYAGLFAPLRALMAGETTLGCTLHQIDTGIDTGPVYSVSLLPAQPHLSVFWHIEQLYVLGVASLLELLAKIEQGVMPELQVQDPTTFRYFGMPKQKDFEQLRRTGVALVCTNAYRELLQRFLPPHLHDDQFRSIAQWIGRVVPEASPGKSPHQ